MKCISKNYQSIAKTGGKMERYKYANVKALLHAEEQQYGRCIFKETHQSFSTKHRQPYCLFTYQPAMYQDSRTGIPYAELACYPLIDAMDKGDILTFERLQKIYEFQHK